MPKKSSKELGTLCSGANEKPEEVNFETRLNVWALDIVEVHDEDSAVRTVERALASRAEVVPAASWPFPSAKLSSRWKDNVYHVHGELQTYQVDTNIFIS